MGLRNGERAGGLRVRCVFRVRPASDASTAQLAAARPYHGVHYVRARADAAPLAPASADLVTDAQALHWLDIPAFWQEVCRVLVKNGTVGPYWAPERALTETGYRAVPFPFTQISVRPPDMTAHLTLPALLGCVGTWSATPGYRAARGQDPGVELRAALAPFWSDENDVRLVRWPLHVRAGRV